LFLLQTASFLESGVIWLRMVMLLADGVVLLVVVGRRGRRWRVTVVGINKKYYKGAGNCRHSR
jgi:hypothetical protein